MFSLSDLRSLCEQRKIPLISQATENFLWEILQKYKPKICLEIGGAVWYSAIFTAGLVCQRWGQVYSFEVSHPAYLEWLIHIRESWLGNITSYPFDIRQAYATGRQACPGHGTGGPIKKLLPKKADFVFIDGQKSQYAEYLEIIETLISDTTILVLDDVIKYHNKLSTLYRFLEKKQMEVNSSSIYKQINYQIVKLEEDDWVMVIVPVITNNVK